MLPNNVLYQHIYYTRTMLIFHSNYFFLLFNNNNGVLDITTEIRGGYRFKIAKIRTIKTQI